MMAGTYPDQRSERTVTETQGRELSLCCYGYHENEGVCEESFESISRLRVETGLCMGEKQRGEQVRLKRSSNSMCAWRIEVDYI